MQKLGPTASGQLILSVLSCKVHSLYLSPGPEVQVSHRIGHESTIVGAGLFYIGLTSFKIHI